MQERSLDHFRSNPSIPSDAAGSDIFDLLDLLTPTSCVCVQERGPDLFRSKGILSVAGTDDK